MLEVNGDTSKRVLESMNGPDEVGTGRATWCKFLNLLSLMEGSQIIDPTITDPNVTT